MHKPNGTLPEEKVPAMRIGFLETKKATALIVSVTALMLLSLVGISFVRVANAERAAASYYADTTMLRLLAQSGIEYAIAQLKDDFATSGNPIKACASDTPWRYYYPDHSPRQDTDDSTGAGIAFSEIQKITDARHPSYYCPSMLLTIGAKQYKVSHRPGVNALEGGYPRNTLKIFDGNSQLNLNTQTRFTWNAGLSQWVYDGSKSTAAMESVLKNLSLAIALSHPWVDDYPSKGNGPLYDYDKSDWLTDNIIQARNNMNGFCSKLDLLQVPGMTREKLKYIWDYITVMPGPTQMFAQNIYKVTRPKLESAAWSETNRETEYCSPVNVNTASWPVLVAVFANLKNAAAANITPTPVNWVQVEISFDEAKSLATEICKNRPSTFAGWSDLETFLLTNRLVFFPPAIPGSETDAEKQTAYAKLAIIRANGNVNLSLRMFNPDVPVYQAINKTDLLNYSTHFCFFPLGYFEITSLGQMFNTAGNVAASLGCYASVRIFDVAAHTSQKDFEGSAWERYKHTLTAADFRNDRITEDTSDKDPLGLNAFSYVSNLQNYSPGTFNKTNWVNAAHADVGYLAPVGYTLTSGMGAFDLTGNAKLLFMANFNDHNTFDATYSRNSLATAGGTKLASTEGNLGIDGVIFQRGATSTLYYSTNCANADPLSTEGNFPATKKEDDHGVLMFWFKVNPDWCANTWHTVFLSTSSTLDKDPLGYIWGVQREVQMRVSGPDTDLVSATHVIDTTIEPDTPILRSLEIQFRCRYFSYQSVGGSAINPKQVFGTTDPFCPYEKRDVGERYAFLPTGMVENNKDTYKRMRGIHAGEWYHVCFFWKEGTKMATSGDIKTPIMLSGNFYARDATDATVNDALTYSGPLIRSKDFDKLGDVGYRLTTTEGTSKLDKAYDKNDNTAANYEAITGNNQTEDGQYFYNTNRFYIGYVPTRPTVTSAAITIDDVRISKSSVSDLSGTDSMKTAFYPTRFPIPGSGTNYGKFRGRFSVPAQAKHMLSGYTLYNPQRGLYDVTKPPKGYKSAGGYALPENDWKDLFLEMMGNPSKTGSDWEAIGNDIKKLVGNKATMEMDGWEDSGNYVKRTDITVYNNKDKPLLKIVGRLGNTNGYVKKYKYEKDDETLEKDYPKDLGNVTGYGAQVGDDPPSATEEKSKPRPHWYGSWGGGTWYWKLEYPDESKTLGECIIGWLLWLPRDLPDTLWSAGDGINYNAPDGVTFTTTPGTQICDYEFAFKAKDSTNPIYLSSYIDDVTLLYQLPEIIFSQFLETGILDY